MSVFNRANSESAEAYLREGLLLRVEDAHDVTKALGVFRDLEF